MNEGVVIQREKTELQVQSFRDFQTNCTLLENALADVHIDPRSDLNKLLTWVRWVADGHGTPSHETHLFSYSLPRIGRALLRRAFPTEAEAQPVAVFLRQLTQLFLSRTDFTTPCAELDALYALLDPGHYFYTHHGQQKLHHFDNESRNSDIIQNNQSKDNRNTSSTLDTREDIHVGMLIDIFKDNSVENFQSGPAQKHQGQWYEGIVINKRFKMESKDKQVELYVAYFGFDQSHDKWISVDSTDIAAYRSKSNGLTGTGDLRWEIDEPIPDRNDDGSTYAIYRPRVKCSSYYLDNVNSFGTGGGIMKMLNRCERLGENKSPPPIQVTCTMISMFSLVSPWLNLIFLKSYLTRFQQAFTSVIENTTEQELRSISKQIIDTIYFALRKFSLRMMNRKDASQYAESTMLQLAYKCLHSSVLENRLHGLKFVSDFIMMINNAKTYPFGIKMVPNSSISTTTTYTLIPILSSGYTMSSQLVNYTENIQLLNLLFNGPLSHEQLIARSHEYLKFLCNEKQFETSHLQCIWQGVVQGIVEYRVPILEALESIVPYMNSNVCAALLQLVHLEAQKSNVTSALISLIGSLAKFSSSDTANSALLANSSDQNTFKAAFSYRHEAILLLWQGLQDVIVQVDANNNGSSMRSTVGYIKDRALLDSCKLKLHENISFHLVNVSESVWHDLISDLLEKCVLNMKHHRSIPQSLELICYVLNLISNSNSILKGKYLEELMRDANYFRQESLMDIFINDVMEFKSNCQTFVKDCGLDDSNEMKDGKLNAAFSLHGSLFEFTEQLKSRFHFLTELMEYSKPNTLQNKHILILWENFNVNAITSLERSMLYKWLVNNMSRTDPVLFNTGNMEYIFFTLFTDDQFLHSLALTSLGFSSFVCFFRSINQCNKKIAFSTMDSSSQFDILVPELDGLETLWRIALHCVHEQVFIQCMRFLTLLPHKLVDKTAINRYTISQIEKGIHYLRTSEDPTILRRGVLILQSFIATNERTALALVTGQFTPHESQARGSTLSIYVSNNIKGSMQHGQKLNVVVHRQDTVLETQVAILVAMEMHEQYHVKDLRYFRAGREILELTRAMTVEEINLKNNEMILVSLRQFSNHHHQYSNSSAAVTTTTTTASNSMKLNSTTTLNSKSCSSSSSAMTGNNSAAPSSVRASREREEYCVAQNVVLFEILLDLIDRNVSDEISQQAWSFLMRLPTNTKIEHMFKSTSNFSDVFNAHSGLSVHQVLYRLQIIDSLIHPSNASGTENVSAILNSFFKCNGPSSILQLILGNHFFHFDEQRNEYATKSDNFFRHCLKSHSLHIVLRILYYFFEQGFALNVFNNALGRNLKFQIVHHLQKSSLHTLDAELMSKSSHMILEYVLADLNQLHQLPIENHDLAISSQYESTLKTFLMGINIPQLTQTIQQIIRYSLYQIKETNSYENLTTTSSSSVAGSASKLHIDYSNIVRSTIEFGLKLHILIATNVSYTNNGPQSATESALLQKQVIQEALLYPMDTLLGHELRLITFQAILIHCLSDNNGSTVLQLDANQSEVYLSILFESCSTMAATLPAATSMYYYVLFNTFMIVTRSSLETSIIDKIFQRHVELLRQQETLSNSFINEILASDSHITNANVPISSSANNLSSATAINAIPDMAIFGILCVLCTCIESGNFNVNFNYSTLMSDIWNDCLFRFPKSSADLISYNILLPTSPLNAGITSNRTKVSNWFSKCTNHITRQSAFRLVYLLCKLNFSSNFNTLCRHQFRTLDLEQFTNDTQRLNEFEWDWDPYQHMKSSVGYVGLRNLGCTCYLNSTLQQLFMLESFRNIVINANTSSGVAIPNSDAAAMDTMTSSNTSVESLKVRYKMIQNAQNVFANLLFGQEKYHNPIQLCESLYDDQMQVLNVMIQQDAEEFFTKFCDLIYENLKHCNNQTHLANELMQNVFGGTICTQLLCQGSCRSMRETTLETFFCMTIEVKGYSELSQSLKNWCQGELLQGVNCDFCGSKQDTVKRDCIANLPNTLVIHLKRFELNFDTFLREKVNDEFSFPMELDMFPYTKYGLDAAATSANSSKQGCANASFTSPIRSGSDNSSNSSSNATTGGEGGDSSTNCMYRLKGCVVHQGSTESGHYYSLISDENNVWFEFNDEKITQFDINQLEAECFGGYMEDVNSNALIPRTKNAYLLIYERITSQHSRNSPSSNTSNASTVSTVHALKHASIDPVVRASTSIDLKKMDDNLIRTILTQNQKFIATCYLKDKAFGAFCIDMVTDMFENLKHHNDDETFVQNATFFTQNCHHAIFILARSNCDPFIVTQLIDTMSNHLHQVKPFSLECMEFVIKHIDLVLQLIIDCPYQSIRNSYSNFVLANFKLCVQEELGQLEQDLIQAADSTKSSSMNTTSNTSSSAITKGKGLKGSLVSKANQLLDVLVNWSIVDHLALSWRQMHDYLKFLHDAIQTHPYIVELCLRKQYGMYLLDMFLGDSSPLIQKVYPAYARKRIPELHPHMFTNTPIGMALCQDFTLLLQIVSNLVRHCYNPHHHQHTSTVTYRSATSSPTSNTNNNDGDDTEMNTGNTGFSESGNGSRSSGLSLAAAVVMAPVTALELELDSNTRECLLLKQFYMLAFSHREYMQAILGIILHWCYNWDAYSTSVMELMLEFIKSGSEEYMESLYILFKSFLLLQDDLQEFRIEYLFHSTSSSSTTNSNGSDSGSNSKTVGNNSMHHNIWHILQERVCLIENTSMNAKGMHLKCIHKCLWMIFEVGMVLPSFQQAIVNSIPEWGEWGMHFMVKQYRIYEDNEQIKQTCLYMQAILAKAGIEFDFESMSMDSDSEDDFNNRMESSNTAMHWDERID